MNYLDLSIMVGYCHSIPEAEAVARGHCPGFLNSGDYRINQEILARYTSPRTFPTSQRHCLCRLRNKPPFADYDICIECWRRPVGYIGDPQTSLDTIDSDD